MPHQREDSENIPIVIIGPEKICEIDEALQLTGYGRFNYAVVLVAGATMLSAITHTMCPMYVTPMSRCDLGLSTYAEGVLKSSSFIGIVASSHFWGYMLDTRGRKKTLIISLTSNCIINLINAFIKWSWLFILLRISCGFCIGSALSGSITYAGEFFDYRTRSKPVVWVSMFVAVAFLYLPSCALAITKLNFSIDLYICDFCPWRLFIVLLSLPNIIAIWGLTYLTETPKFLIAMKKPNSTLRLLRRMYATNTRNNPENYPVTKVTYEGYETGYRVELGFFYSVWIQTRALLKPPFIQRCVLLSFLQFVIFFFAAGIMLWYPNLVMELEDYSKTHPHETITLCEATVGQISGKESSTCTIERGLFNIMIIVSLAYGFVYVFVAFTIDYFGKKNLIYFFLCLEIVSGIIINYITGYKALQISLGVYLMGNVNISLIFALAVDLFPTAVRGMGVALSSMVGRVGAIAGGNLIGAILNNDKYCPSLFISSTITQLVEWLIIAKLPSK